MNSVTIAPARPLALVRPSSHAKRLIQSAALALLLPLTSTAAPRLELQFVPGTVVVRGASPGARTVWMALLRERVGSHVAVRVHRGFAVASAEGVARVDHAAAAAPRALWAVADADRGGVGQGIPPEYGISQVPVIVNATAGANVIIVEAPEVRLLFVSPPAGAWAFDAADGSDLDADRLADGRITIPLSALRAIQGNRPAPEQIAAGDVVLAIDPNRVRIGEVIVP